MIQQVIPHQWSAIGQLEAVAEELYAHFHKTLSKTRSIVQQIFDAIQNAKHAILTRDERVITQLHQLQTEIETLWLTRGQMDPEAMAEELVALTQKLEKVEEPPCAQGRTLHKTVASELQRLEFHYAFPGVDELEEPGLFATTLNQIASEIRDTNSLQPFTQLSATQQAEVLAQVGNATVSPEGLAHGIECYLEALRAQAAVAFEFFVGKLDQGLGGILTLPEAVQTHIDQLIWDATNGEGLDPLLPQSQAEIANAVLTAMEQRMGFND